MTDSGAATKLARLLLVLTSIAPVLLVWAAVLYGRVSGGLEWWMLGATAACLWVMCWWMLRMAKGSRHPTNYAVNDPQERDGDSLAFLIAYALPLAAADQDSTPSVPGIATFVMVMAFLVWQQQLYHVNPLIGCLGYHFFSANNDSGARVLVLSNSKTLSGGNLPIVKLSDYLWMHCP